jgi:hypothetical protein
MKIYWTYKSIPELRDLPAKEAWKVYVQAYLQTFTNWRGWIAVMVMFLLLVLNWKIIHIFFQTPVYEENQLKDLVDLILGIMTVLIYSQMATENVRCVLRKVRDAHYVQDSQHKP